MKDTTTVPRNLTSSKRKCSRKLTGIESGRHKMCVGGTPVALNFPNAVALEYSSSCCGDPLPQNYFPCYFLTVMLLLLWMIMSISVFSGGLGRSLRKDHLFPKGIAAHSLRITAKFTVDIESKNWREPDMVVHASKGSTWKVEATGPREKASLGYTVRLWLRNKTKNEQKLIISSLKDKTMHFIVIMRPYQ